MSNMLYATVEPQKWSAMRWEKVSKYVYNTKHYWARSIFQSLSEAPGFCELTESSSTFFETGINILILKWRTLKARG